MMLLKMLKFEWLYFIRQPSFIVTSLVFFLLPYLSITVENIQIGGGGNIDFNSPFSIAQSILILGFFSMFLVVNFVANTAIRNDLVKMSEILYSKPIRPFQYQLGRFLGAYLVLLLVLLMVPLGIFVGSLMPWLDAERLGRFNLSAYIVPFLIFSVPTSFVLSTLFYAAALRFRSMMAVYLIALALFVIYGASGAIFSESYQRDMMAITDPFGIRAFSDVTRYWTPSEKNTEIVMLTGNVLINRIVWLAVGIIFLFGFGKMFSPLGIAKTSDNKTKVDKAQSIPFNNDTSYAYTPGADFSQFIARVVFEVKQLVLSPAFIILLLIGAVHVITAFINPAGIYGASNWPLTQYMIELIQDAFSLSLIIVITYYSAEVVWRERITGVGDIIDSMPVQNFTFWFSKLIAVCIVIIALLLVGMLATLANQLANSYLNFDISQYLISLLYFTAIPWILLVILAFFIQALSPNKYVGMLIFVAYFFASLAFFNMGIEHNMFNFGVTPSMQYSDMNGYGWSITTQHYYLLYWGALALVLSAFSYALWQRGPETNLKQGIAQLGYGLGRFGQAIVIVGIVGFISIGTVIHYNTKIINQYVSSDEMNDKRANYEKSFAQFEDKAIPTVSAVDLNVAIFPALRKLEAIAELSITNKSEETIEKFLVNYPEHSSIEINGASISDYNSELKSAWMTLHKPLKVGGSSKIKVSVTRQHRGFKDKNEDVSLIKNGTFINNLALLPSFGVNKSYYLEDQHERRKRDLPPPQRAYKLEDESRYYESVFGKYIDLIDFKATLSTSGEQIAIAPGYLQKYWTDGGRNYFSYEMDTPMANFYNIMSADLVLKTENYQGIDITVYFHKEHAWNVDRMIKSTKDAIELFSKEFGPYQHKQLRIVEFPGYREFAQSFANTVPYSERIGFISDLRNTEEIDPVYYITAHEVAHQWFGHQLDAANVQGSAILSESLSQYAALQVMLQEYGEVKIRKFLTYELDSYLYGRSNEYLEEMPFMRAENQQYIHYGKGSIVMMAIADRIGYAELNSAIKALIDKYKYSQHRRATTLDLLNAIKAESTAEDYAFVQQQFEQITLYDIRLTNAELVLDSAEISLTIDANRYSADGYGNETKKVFDDLVDIVIFNDDPNDFKADTTILYRQKHKVVDGENQLLLSIKSLGEFDLENAYIGVDPFVRFIDRDSKDNIIKL